MHHGTGNLAEQPFSFSFAHLPVWFALVVFEFKKKRMHPDSCCCVTMFLLIIKDLLVMRSKLKTVQLRGLAINSIYVFSCHYCAFAQLDCFFSAQ